MRLNRLICWFAVAMTLQLGFGFYFAQGAEDANGSDPARIDSQSEKPIAWPGGVVPYDLSKLTDDQAAQVKEAMRLWMESGANIRFVPRTTEAEYVFFTGKTDEGNNTTFNGFRKGARLDINITAFWWRQGPWMPAHELGHALGFHHEHQRWDRDRYVTIRYEHIKPGREFDYNWIPKTNWIAATAKYDYRSIMHYRTCWASRCESECKDGFGESPCAVIDPIGAEFDRVIGQWTDNKISAGDVEKARLAYGVKEAGSAKNENQSEPKKQPVDWAALFKIHWQNRIKAFKEQNLSLQNVVLLGDSITEGFEVAKYFPGRRILNRGIGADVIGNNMPPDDPRGVLQRLDESVFDCAATDVFILIGINDLNTGRTVESMERGYRELLKRLRDRQPTLKIHVQSVLPTGAEHAKQNAPALAFNEQLKKLAHEFKCNWIDLHALMRDDKGELKAEFTQDGLHLTEAGYRVWRAEILKTLQWD